MASLFDDLTIGKHTYRILDKIPYWFSIRKNYKDSIGAAFLNIMGLQLDDIEAILNYAYEQCYIGTADISFMDIAYKAIVPVHINATGITSVYSSTDSLERVDKITDFYSMNLKTHYKQTHGHNVYFLDEEKNIIYLRRPYDKNKNKQYGFITYICNGIKCETDLYLHPIWNYFDEFGLLLACPRLKEEKNSEYKNRLLDVFKHPAGSNPEGLMHGIARELGIKIYAEWKDMQYDFIIEQPMVILNAIFVNNKRLPLNEVFIMPNDSILIKANPVMQGQSARVEYIAGMHLQAMTNKKDLVLHNKLYNIEMFGTDLLKDYIRKIDSIAPTDWGQFIWDFSHWDTHTRDINGSSFLPNLYDASYKGFANYKG